MLDHHAVIAGEIGLAFAAVHHQGVHLRLLGHGKLGVRREGGAAQADHAGIPDRLQDVGAGGGFHVACLAPQIFLRRAGLAANNNRLGPRSARGRPEFDGLDHAGHRRVVRHRQPVVGARDRLAAHDVLADLDDGMGRLADMLHQRHRHARWIGQAADATVGRGLLARGRMHAALKGLAPEIVEELHVR